MVPTDIESLLASRIGFDTQTVGASAVDTAFRLAMHQAGFADAAAYARRVAVDPAAWEALVDRIVVQETSFFRDGAPFDLVAEFAYARWRRDPMQIVRILSCPCSTGEEPYSLAMALLDGGLPKGSFLVSGVDLSQAAVAAARGGDFRSSSFRGTDLSYRARYFDPTPDGRWRVRDVARTRVDVRQGNILSPDFLADQAPFDIVFCRNLMIYLHASAKAVTMAAIRRLMEPDGMLVVGHAESAIARDHGFTPIRRAGAFAFVKAIPGIVEHAPGVVRQTDSPGVPKPRSTVPAAAVVSPRAAVPPSNALALAPPESALTRARRLADAGYLQEALQVCREHLERAPDSAEGHFLMGVLHDAEGSWPLALPSLRRALYLDPSHLGALRHMALKREASGDDMGAERLRDRARRVGEASGGE